MFDQTGQAFKQGLINWLLLVGLVIMWGSAFFLNTIALESFPPMTLTAIRIIIGAVILWFFLGFHKEELHRLPLSLILWFTLMAVFGNSLPFFLINWGQQYVSSSLAGIFMAMMPLFTLVLAHFFLPSERLTTRRSIGFLLGFGGIVVLMNPQTLLELGSSSTELMGQLAVLAGAICYAIAAIIARRKPQSNDLITATMVLTLASLITLPASFALENPWLKPLSNNALIAVVLLSTFSTGLATLAYFKLLRRTSATFIAQVNYLIPIWALLAGVIFLKEAITTNAVIALLMILLGIGVANFRKN